MNNQRSPEQTRELIEEIDSMKKEVTQREADFIESLLSQTYPWTERQLNWANAICDKYLPF